MKSVTCCPPFDAEAWDDRVLRFDHLRFIKRRVACLYNVPLNFGPLNFGPVIRRAKRTIEAHQGEIAGGLVFSDHRSPWRMDALIAIDQGIPDVLPALPTLCRVVGEELFGDDRTNMMTTARQAFMMKSK